MARYYTIEIEHAFGKGVDLRAVWVVLDAINIKISTSQEGCHLLRAIPTPLDEDGDGEE